MKAISYAALTQNAKKESHLFVAFAGSCYVLIGCKEARVCMVDVYITL